MSLNDFRPTNALGPDTLFALPQAASRTYAPTHTPPKEVIVEPLALTRLPTAMRNMDWHTAAALMQRWFDSPAWEMPEGWKEVETQPNSMSLSAAHCDQSIVKMDWAMGFERCREAVEAVEKKWASVNGMQLLAERLRDAGWKGKNPFRLGSNDMPAVQLDALSQVNFTKFGSAWDALDDMYGSLGSATLKVAVTGTAFSREDQTTKQTQYYFQIDNLGFYIRDHYDFNGTQYLGTWTEDRVLTKAETAVSTTPYGNIILRLRNGPFAIVTNGDFQKYRDKKQNGGDFLIFSDVLWKKVDQVVDLGPWT